MNPSPTPRDLQDFLARLEAAGELCRVQAEVDPELEITEIATRVVRMGGPALLFERVKGSPFPLSINLFGGARRIEIALGRPPARVGTELREALEQLQAPTPARLWKARRTLWRATKMRVRRVRHAPCRQVVEAPDLGKLPILKCWPLDAGPFLTFPLVRTARPDGSEPNVGLYRMQVFSRNETGLHWQIQKGGGFHHHEAEAQGRPLEVAVAIGGDPVLMMAGMWPLPEGIDEAAFSGLIRGRPTRMTRARTLRLDVPADAEFVLEGIVLPGERRLEGPFGDHYGHYSGAADFPVLHVKKVTRKAAPVYAASVVGKPPQEDRYLGDAVQEMFSPVLLAMRPEVREIWSFYEGGFHTLLGVSVASRYRKEGLKSAMGLLGEGALSLSKIVVVVNHETSPRSFRAILRAIRERFRPSRDFLLLPGTSMDTLDFTGPSLNLGSKMVLDASGDPPEAPPPPAGRALAGLASHDLPEMDHALLESALLVVRLQPQDGHRARDVLERLTAREDLAGIKIIAVVSDDVDLDDDSSIIWGIFTRFDPATDVVFGKAALRGACPVYDGPLGIDATRKPAYPPPLAMDPDVVLRVTRRWDELFPRGW